MTIRTPQFSKASKLTRTLLAVTVSAALLTTAPLTASAAAANTISISINGQMQSFAQPPVMIDNRVYVPMRALLESLGYEVRWNESVRTILASRGRETIFIDLDHKRLNHSDVIVSSTLDIPIQIINGRTLIPVRYISELSGADVQWDAANQRVVITSGKDNAMFSAILQDDLFTVRTLLEQGLNPNIQKDNIASAFTYAVAAKNTGIARLLAEKGAVIGEGDLATAFWRNDPELLRWLLTSPAFKKTPAQLATELLSDAQQSCFHHESVKVLLSLGADPNKAKSQSGESLLSIELDDNKDIALIQDLLNAGADPDTYVRSPDHQDNNQIPALVHAVETGSLEITNLLLDHEAEPNIRTATGWTPLMVAAEHGNVKLVQMLLAHKADVHAVNDNGGTALDIAIAHGNTETIAALRAAGANETTDGLPEQALFSRSYDDNMMYSANPLPKAVIRGETQNILPLLSAPKGEHRYSNGELLSLAVWYGNVETTQTLLANLNFQDLDITYPLESAMSLGNEELVRILGDYAHSHGFQYPDGLLRNLINNFNNNPGTVQALFATGLTPNSAAELPLFNIAGYGYPELAKLFLQAGADPNVQDEYRKGTALDIAIQEGQTETLKALLTSDKLTRDTKGNALITAVKRGSLDMVTLLLQAGADVHFQRPDGHSPMETATQAGDQEMIDLLSSAGTLE